MINTNQDSYKLDHIVTVELGNGKLSYEEAGTRLSKAKFVPHMTSKAHSPYLSCVILPEDAKFIKTGIV